MKQNILVGITGGLGAGKSKVSAVLRAEGYPVLDADVLSREVTAPGTTGIDAVVKAFGKECLHENGSLNRAWLRSCISRDPAMKKKLEMILHPLIQQEFKKQSTKLFQAGANIVFYEASLLFEAKSQNNVDLVICVHASDSIRIQRVIERDGKEASEVELLLKSQMPQEEKMKRSKFNIPNDGDEALLRQKTLTVLDSIKAWQIQQA